jgi:site-specific DNA-methyltransferase (adenine-specific)
VNRLFYGDNLDVLRQHVADESVDLVYLDPPFNSAKNYNLIFAHRDVITDADAAQIQAFSDTWHWTPTTDTQFSEYTSGGLPLNVSDALVAFHTLLGENDAMAYLVNMAPRLVELHRVLKPTGSLYLHCDPTMSHYLKILLDAIFDARFFRNEIIWNYNTGGKGKQTFLRKHDTILWFSKSEEYQFHRDEVAVPRSANTAHLRHGFDEDGREYYEDYSPRKSGKMYRWYLDEGVTPMDVWTDIPALNPMAKERLGYPTQKPLALMRRILTASSKPGDVVLDPFCGCGTTVDAAQEMGREWIGIDVTYLAVDLIEKRLTATHGDEIKGTYEVGGIPRDKQAALALFSKNPFEFERWAVTMLNGQPNQKQVGDKGIDGVARFPVGDVKKRGVGEILISVKGGKTLNPAMVRDLGGTVTTRKADLGVLITNGAPTPGMIEEANHAGTYTHPATGTVYPRIQMITTGELLGGKRPNLPGTMNPYLQAHRLAAAHDQPELFEP